MFPIIFFLACSGKESDTAITDTAQSTDTSDSSNGDSGSEPSDTSEPNDTADTSDTSDTGDSMDTSDTSDTDNGDWLSIVGGYTSQYSDEHIITANVYTMDFGSEVYEYFITSYDNQSRTIIAENGSINGDPAEHGKFSRFDWVVDNGGTLYVCQTTAYASSESDALNTTPANSNDLANGCPGYGWLELTPL